MVRKDNLVFNIIIDEEDEGRLNELQWHVSSKGYAIGTIDKYRYIQMHRMVMGAKTSEIIDHINGNKLDNRKCNLRFCTMSQNSMNIAPSKNKSSEFKGVTKHSNTTWLVSIKKDGKIMFSGIFTNEVAAANAYNYYADKYHEEFAYPNKVLPMSKEEWGKYLKIKTVPQSEYRGVYWDKCNEKWRCRIQLGEKTYNIGRFISEKDALEARNAKYITLGIDVSITTNNFNSRKPFIV